MTTSPRWRVALASAASAAALVATPLAGASTAYAQYGPLPPTLTVTPTTVAAGGTVTIHAENFPANTVLTEELHSNDGRTANSGGSGGNGGNRRHGSSGRSVRGGHDDHGNGGHNGGNGGNGGHNGGNGGDGGNRGDGVFLGTVTTDATGAATDTVTIPVCTSPGYHFLEVESERPHLEAWARIRVLAAVNGGADRCGDDGRGDEGRGDEGRGDDGGREEGRGQGGQSEQSMGGAESSGRDEFSGRNESSGRPGSDQRNGARRQGALAATGSEKAMALGGTAAVLVVLGGGTMMAMRRRRSS